MKVGDTVYKAINTDSTKSWRKTADEKQKLYKGRVVFVSPKGRFYTAEFVLPDGRFCESFYL